MRRSCERISEGKNAERNRRIVRNSELLNHFTSFVYQSCEKEFVIKVNKIVDSVWRHSINRCSQFLHILIYKFVVVLQLVPFEKYSKQRMRQHICYLYTKYDISLLSLCECGGHKQNALYGLCVNFTSKPNSYYVFVKDSNAVTSMST